MCADEQTGEHFHCKLNGTFRRFVPYIPHSLVHRSQFLFCSLPIELRAKGTMEIIEIASCSLYSLCATPRADLFRTTENTLGVPSNICLWYTQWRWWCWCWHPFMLYIFICGSSVRSFSLHSNATFVTLEPIRPD